MSNIEEQLKASLKAILSKPIKAGENKPVATAAWISDKKGTPFSGLLRKGGDTEEMDKAMLAKVATVPTLLWNNIPRAVEELQNLEKKQKSEINHVTVGFYYPGSGDILSGNMEISVIKYGNYYLNSVYKIPEKR
ncbi:MAG: hypothetical protein ACFFD4_14405 [Candidatus Odinarchaeota archaeon]